MIYSVLVIYHHLIITQFAPGSGLKSGKLDSVVMNIDSELNQWLEATPAHSKSGRFVPNGYANQTVKSPMGFVIPSRQRAIPGSSCAAQDGAQPFVDCCSPTIH
jgi:hypothetical protein